MPLPWKMLKSSFLLFLGTRRGCVSYSAGAWKLLHCGVQGWIFLCIGEGSFSSALLLLVGAVGLHCQTGCSQVCSCPCCLSRTGFITRMLTPRWAGMGCMCCCYLVRFSDALGFLGVLILLQSVVTGGNVIHGCTATGVPLLPIPGYTFLVVGGAVVSLMGCHASTNTTGTSRTPFETYCCSGLPTASHLTSGSFWRQEEERFHRLLLPPSCFGQCSSGSGSLAEAQGLCTR